MADDVEGRVGSMICGRCGLTLSRLTLRENGVVVTRWGHPSEQFKKIDHEVLPIPYEEQFLVSVCDFCNERVVLAERSYLPVKDFDLGLAWQNPRTGAEELQLYKNRGGYNCCPTCAGMVSVNDWSGLEQRYLRLHDETHMGPLAIIWEAVRENILAPVRPWQDGDQITND